MSFGGGMMKAAASKAVIIKLNLAFLGFFLLAYFVLFVLQPSSIYEQNATKIVRCTLHDCHMKKVEGVVHRKIAQEKRGKTTEKVPHFLQALSHNMSIGLVNMEDNELIDWSLIGKTQIVEFEHVSDKFEWKDLFPEWIDEEEENEGASCPEIPMPNFQAFEELDMIVAKLPCKHLNNNWARDVFRLQIHLIVANLALQRGRTNDHGAIKIVFVSECMPMMEIFRCDDLVAREEKFWLYESHVKRFEEKMNLPIGSCKLALPLWEEGTNKKFNTSKLSTPATPRRREAYATVLHSSDAYVCGALALAHSLKITSTSRDLILLHDDSIPTSKLKALADAGWILRRIIRIRNPHATNGSYNEYNYSKFRLWQLTEYHKIVFVDADILVLRSIDILFSFPQLSATGNDGVIFNSGVMVIEPSNCTFNALMARREDVVSYNGGDQGFLNEVLVWWHRLPRRVNFLKNYWSNTSAETAMKNFLFSSMPPKLYSVHYLGLKPWMCYRDYDCNFNVEDQRVYASDEAHRTWWNVHDSMNDGLKMFCMLTEERKDSLEYERKTAEKLGFSDGHWRWNVSDVRRMNVLRE